MGREVRGLATGGVVLVVFGRVQKTGGGLRACGFGVWGALLVRWVCCLELSATVTRPGQTIDGLATGVFKLVAPRCFLGSRSSTIPSQHRCRPPAALPDRAKGVHQQ